MKTIIFCCFIVIVYALSAEIVPYQEKNESNREQIHQTFTNSDPVKEKKHANTGEAKALLKKALDYMKEQGTEKAFSEFNKPGSQFFHKDLYIFAIDMEGNVLAHGGELDLVGTNQYNLKDSFGKLFIQDFIEQLYNKKTAVVEYHWRNYETLKIESKLSYLEKFSNNIFLGCGIYYGEKK